MKLNMAARTVTDVDALEESFDKVIQRERVTAEDRAFARWCAQWGGCDTVAKSHK